MLILTSDPKMLNKISIQKTMKIGPYCILYTQKINSKFYVEKQSLKYFFNFIIFMILWGREEFLKQNIKRHRSENTFD